MPNVGDVETKFGRKYMFLNPDPALGPGTWRLAAANNLPDGGGGGGSGYFDIDGVAPITVDQISTGETTISMDMITLDNREAP